MNLTAVHYIQRRQDGKRADVTPGQSFEASGAEADFLLKSGAARKAAGKKAEPTVEQKDEDDISQMTKPRLIEFAVDNEIEINPSDNKPEILATIEAALAGDDLV